jgi:ABC-type lipoprotein release transport system permease subunit
VSQGQAFLSPGVLARYRSQVESAENASVRLVHGAADVPALQRDVNALVAPGAPVLDMHAVSRRVNTTLSVEHAALLLLALVVAIAGGLLVGQALVRSASAVADDAATLRAVGMTRTDLVAATGVSHVVVAALTSVAAFAAAVVLSQWFPVGLGRRIDPDVGIHVDWVVLVPGALLVGLIVLALCAVAAARAAKAHRRPAGPALPGLAARVARVAPLTVGLSTAMAFGRRPGQTRIAARPAVIAAVVAVAGIVGALTIEQGVNDSLAHPERAGVVWDASVTPTTRDLTTTGVSPDLESRVAAAVGPGAALAVVTRDLVDVNSIGVAAFTVRPIQGEASTPIAMKLTEGRAPTDLGEAAIGPATARELRVHVGDVLTVGSSSAKVRVVGEALFPNDVHSEFDEGLWLAPAQFDAVLPPSQQNEGGVHRVIAIRLAHGADKNAVGQRLGSEIGSRATVEPAFPPDELMNLRNVRALPLFLAGFLALLAVGALSHVLIGSARRRRKDFAVLRSFGMTRRQSRLVLNSLGTTIGLIGVVVGIPLGIAIGRAGWRLVTERVPLVDVAPFALLAVVLVLPATLLAANALAVWPGGVVARRRMPAQVLRTE